MTTHAQDYIPSRCAAEQRQDLANADRIVWQPQASRHPAIVAQRARRIEAYRRQIEAGRPITYIPRDEHPQGDPDGTGTDRDNL